MALTTKPPIGAVAQRDKQPNEIRRALRDTALELFASQGFKATNVSEIAKMAGVSTRTFFRYFPSKESALYCGEAGWLQDLLDIYPTHPATGNDLDALSATLTELAPRIAKSRESLLLYQRAAALSLALRGLDQAHQRATTEVLAWAIAARRGSQRPDDGCMLLAATALLVFRRSLDIWLSGRPDTDLAMIIRTEFELLRDQFTGLVTATGARSSVMFCVAARPQGRRRSG